MQVASAQYISKLQFAVHLKEHMVVRQVCKDTGTIIQKLCVLANFVYALLGLQLFSLVQFYKFSSINSVLGHFSYALSEIIKF